MRLTDLRHAKVRTFDGKTIGRVFEVHADGGRITALMCGATGFLERLTSKTHGHRIPWEKVHRISGREIVLSSDELRKDRGRPSRTSRRT